METNLDELEIILSDKCYADDLELIRYTSMQAPFTCIELELSAFVILHV